MAVDLALRELVESVVVPERTDTPFGTYVIPSSSPAAEIGRAVERDVFLEYFGNTPELLAAEYGRYEPASLFLCVLDHRRLLPAGVMRMITPTAAGQKTIDDVRTVWGRSFADMCADVGAAVAPEALWDIATLAVARDYRGKGEGIISLALYQAAFQTALPTGIRWFVALLDDVVVDLIETRLGHPFTFFPTVEPKQYLDSPATRPVLVDIDDYRRRLAMSDAAMHALLMDGLGLEAAVAPPDWASDTAAAVALVH